MSGSNKKATFGTLQYTVAQQEIELFSLSLGWKNIKKPVLLFNLCKKNNNFPSLSDVNEYSP